MSAGDLPRTVAHVDGGSRPNPGHGAWAAVLKTRGRTRDVCGEQEHSTNQRAEIMAAITALEALDEPSEIEIVSDSMYLTNCGSGR